MKSGSRPVAIIIWWLLLLGTLIAWWLKGLNWPLRPLDFAGLVLILPLAGTLVPVARDSSRAMAAATLLLIPYLGWGFTEILANPTARVLATLSVLFGLACFGALILRLRQLRSG